MSFKIFVDESDLHFFISKTEDEYRAYAEKHNNSNLPLQFRITEERLQKNLKFCDRKILCWVLV